MKKIALTILSLFLATNLALAEQLGVISEFKGLSRSPVSAKVADGSHTVFNNVYIKDGNIQAVKGRDRLNATANADTVVNGIWYYENGAGTTKKYVVKESDEVVTYATDWTGRTQIAGTLTNESVSFEQIGDTLYFNSSTDGLYKWTGSGSASAVGSVSAPSSVDFSATTGEGGMTPGEQGVAVLQLTVDSTCSTSESGSCRVGCVRGSSTTDGADNSKLCTAMDGTNQWQLDCASSTTYKYKVVKHSSAWDIISEPSSSDSATLDGANTATWTTYGKACDNAGTTCTTENDLCDPKVEMHWSGAQTRTTGTLASAPSAPFDEYCVYRTVAGGDEYFLVGCQGTGAFTDGKPDESLLRPLDTTIDHIAPPSYAHLAEFRGVLFTGENNTIQFTRLPVDAVTSADTYWLETDKLNLGFRSPMTGMHKTANSLLVYNAEQIEEINGFGYSNFRVQTAVRGFGPLNDEVVETDNSGDVIFFAGTQGVYKLIIADQPQDTNAGIKIDRRGVNVLRISSPELDEIFRGNDDAVSLDPADYANSHAFYDQDNDLYFLFIGSNAFIYDNINRVWSVMPATQMIASVYAKSPGIAGTGLLIDNLGFAFNNWTGYENGVASGTVTGNPTSSTSTTLADTGASFLATNDGLKGLWVAKVTSAVSDIEYRQISSNTSTVLTVSSAWTVNPTTSDTYYIAHIIPDWKTKQINFDKAPNETDIRSLRISYEQADTTQNLFVDIFREKATSSSIGAISLTCADNANCVDLSSNVTKKLGVSGRSAWLAYKFRTYIYNTSNTISPPLNIESYAFHGIKREVE